MKKCLLLLAIILVVGVRNRAAAELPSYAPEIRRSTFADDVLFHDLLGAPGGVGMVDEVFFPKAKERKIIHIEIKVPYDGRQAGVERWTIEHAEGDDIAYRVNLIPDGQGGTTFAVEKDQGKTFGGTAKEAEGNSAFSFQNTRYFYRWPLGDQQFFTPKGQTELGTWSDMIIVGRYPTVQDGAALTTAVNTIFGNSKKRGAIVLGAHYIPKKNGQATEYFTAMVLGQRDVELEADFSRYVLSGGMGHVLSYQHRIYGANVGNEMSAWLKVNGPLIEKELLNWDAAAVLKSLPAYPALAP
jgi:hypothetical protein